MNILLAVLVLYPFAGGLLTWLIAGSGEKETVPFAKKYFTRSGMTTVFFTLTEFLLMGFLFLACFGEAGEGELLSFTIPEVCGFGLSFTLEGFRLIFCTIASIMWLMTSLMSQQYFSGHHNTARFYVFMLLTLGATMGVFLSADFYTTFVFFEIMSFTSYVWVAHEENNAALNAADTYLAVAVIGGLVMLMGILGLYHELGTLSFSELPAAAAAFEHKGILYALGACMLVGFGAKAGAFPLHIWLPKAHPVAPAPASALLSGMLTKTGIFGVLMVTVGMFFHDQNWGSAILIIGSITMFLGALLAVFSVDLKRTLACSSMSQIGFILIGVGMQCMLGEENMLAVHGTFLHMANHSLIKLVLFMAAGVIFMSAHSLNLNEIRGWGRKKPLIKVIFLLGALAIGGIPLFSGYISKTLLHESIVEFGGGFIFRALEYLFLISGGMTVGYMTKLFVAIFVEKNEDEEKQKEYDEQKSYMNPITTAALSASALLLLVWGMFPHGIMDRAAEMAQSFMGLEEFGEVINYFSWSNLSGSLISISIGVVVYCLIRRFLIKKNAYINAWPAKLDLENLIYRPLLLNILPTVFGTICRGFDQLLDALVKIAVPVGSFFAHILDGLIDTAQKIAVPVGAFFARILDDLIDTAQKIAVPVGAFFARIFDTLTDLSVVGLRKTVYKDSPIPEEQKEGNWFTALIGNLMNAFQSLLNHTVRRHSPKSVDYRHEMALRYDMWRENSMVVSRSLSFGLLLIMIGFVVTLVIILWP